MQKNKLLFVSLAVILATTILVYILNYGSITYKPGSWPEADRAVSQADHFYQLKKAEGENMSDGPCLSNDLIPGWVADIVHNPRQEVDNRRENQCPAYLEGRAKHFVELDLDGKLVKIE